jgi:hypothetical protein
MAGALAPLSWRCRDARRPPFVTVVRVRVILVATAIAASSTSTVVVVIWAVVTPDYAHLPAFRNLVIMQTPFTIDSHRDVY